MAENEKEKRVPNLRFKGFTDDWIKCELKELVKPVRSYPLSRKYETENDTGYRYIHYGDIHTGVANIISDEYELPYILEDNYETLEKGDVILADASEDYQGIAWPSVLNTLPKEKIVAGLHTIALRPIEDVDSLFMYYTFLSTDFRKFGYKMGTGMKVFGITRDNLLKYNFSLPMNTTEQIKIRKLLDSLNKLITLEQDKLDIISDIKSFILREMYSPNNNGRIKQHKLYNFISRKGKINKENKKYIVSSVNNELGFVKQNEQFENTRLDNLDKSTYRIVNPEEFAYNPSRVNVGSIGYNNDSNKLIISPLYVVFALDGKVNNEYLYYYTKTESFLYEVSRNTEGSVRKNLSFKNLGNINLPLPNNYRDQLFIANFLNKLDEIIVNMNQKIDTHRNIKKYILQNLFV